MAGNNNNNDNNNSQSSINLNPSQAIGGMDLDSAISSIKPGMLTFAVNAVTSDISGNSIKYQNEPGNALCTTFPTGYNVNGTHVITEDNITVVWLAGENGESEIGTVTDCVYSKYINADCLGLDIHFPIHKAFHRTTPLGTEVYWTDAKNERRYINLSVPPLLKIPNADGCGWTTSGEIDCNQLAVQPDFAIPQIDVSQVEIGGSLLAGTYQFAVQYGSADSEPYTAFYSVTNPLPLGNVSLVTPDFNYIVGKSIKIDISNIDTSGVYQFINVAVIKAVNLITSVELIGTYQIEKSVRTIIYSGEKKDNIRLTADDIFEKYPIYEKANDAFTIGDRLAWVDITTNERLNYQNIWTNVHLQWQTYRIPQSEGYLDAITSTDRKGYFRDEIYPFEGCFLLRKGGQSDRFHIPGRTSTALDVELVDNSDVLKDGNTVCNTSPVEASPKWKVYNTGYVLDFADEWKVGVQDDCYNGPHQYGEFAYTESSDTYPCDAVLWGGLAGQPIRYHKFPDSSVTHIHDNQQNIYPIGVRVNVQQIIELINNSSLTAEQKNNIVGFKILRGDRVNNKSVVARGLVNNVLKYSTSGTFSADNPQKSVQTQVQSLITQSLSLISKTDVKISVFFEQSAHNTMSDAKAQLNSAYSLAVGSPEFIAAITQADKDVNNVIALGIDDVTNSYLQGVDSILQNLIEIDPIEVSLLTSNNNTSDELYFPNYLYNDVSGNDPYLNNTKIDDSSKERYAFHSPDTHFYQPYLGNILKLETIEQGLNSSHMVEVKKHSKYQFLSTIAYITSALSGLGVGFASGQYGVSTKPFDGTAAFTAYKTILDILYKVSPRRNFCYQQNSVGEYTQFLPVPNSGNKQRSLDIATYLVPGIQSVGETDGMLVNNFERESSVYLKTSSILPFTHEMDTNALVDNSKYLIPDYGVFNRSISSFYATIKNDISNQYGQVYSYQTLDTGSQRMINLSSVNNGAMSVFGGDCFINKFAYKNKIPFFIDNRVGFPDEADVFYDELNNVGVPKYWFSTDVTRHNSIFGSIFGTKPHKFYWERDGAFTDYGNIFLFAYGIPYFFCESEVNVDYRQAFNDKEGDFYPRVQTGIPDEWLQEFNTSIKQDNTYFYNKTYSKQNKENFFSSIPPDYDQSYVRQYLTHSAIWSDPQKEIVNYKHNNWLLYKPDSRFDFPKSKGAIISIDNTYENECLVRYENTAQLYNAYLTIATSGKAAYLGNDEIFRASPPIDLSDVETGYGGSYNKLMIKTELGPIIFDTKRGAIFTFERGAYMKRANLKDISGNLTSFFLNEFIFYIKKSFPSYPVDNHFNKIGLTGLYDPFYKRIVFTKRDYQCIDPLVVYDGTNLTKNGTVVNLDDTTYFINKSFTLSFGFDINAYVSFHTYIPDFYVPAVRTFYTGRNNTISDLWSHESDDTNLNNFYGNIHPYILEFPYSYKYQDEILQNIKDYTRVLQYNKDGSYIQTDDVFFNQAILRNEQQCSGVLNLVPKPRHSLRDYMKYPQYNTDSKTIIFTKSDSFYNYNTFWSLIKDRTKPILVPSTTPSMFWDINQSNMNYSKMSFGKAPLRSKELRIRHILNNTSSYKMISEFLISPTQISYK